MMGDNDDDDILPGKVAGVPIVLLHRTTDSASLADVIAQTGLSVLVRPRCRTRPLIRPSTPSLSLLAESMRRHFLLKPSTPFFGSAL